eukprot:UN21549
MTKVFLLKANVMFLNRKLLVVLLSQNLQEKRWSVILVHIQDLSNEKDLIILTFILAYQQCVLY